MYHSYIFFALFIGRAGGWSECFWSAKLHKCISPSYAPLKCLGGVCGSLLSGSKDHCPTPCDTRQKCKSCLQQTRCGWCSLDSDGMGACLEGTMQGPSHVTHCDMANYTHSGRICFIWYIKEASEFDFKAHKHKLFEFCRQILPITLFILISF